MCLFVLKPYFTICCDETFIPVRVGVDDDCVDVDDIPVDRCSDKMLANISLRKPLTCRDEIEIETVLLQQIVLRLALTCATTFVACFEIAFNCCPELFGKIFMICCWPAESKKTEQST